MATFYFSAHILGHKIMKKIQSKLTMRASAELEKEIEEELKIEDPDSEQAKAILNTDEDSKRDDGTTSNRDDQ